MCSVLVVCKIRQLILCKLTYQGATLGIQGADIALHWIRKECFNEIPGESPWTWTVLSKRSFLPHLSASVLHL